MQIKAFLRELKNRRVYRVALGYGVAASAVVQVGGTILPIFHAAEWVQQVFVVALAVGFPIALMLAWAFDITREGIQRTPDAAGLHVSNRRQIRVLGIAGAMIAALALSGYWFWHPWKNPRASTVAESSTPAPEKSIAVLPFTNLSAEQANAFFTDGVQDQILTDLAKVGDLKVISHTSVRPYKSEESRDLREIGRQLGVAYLLEGSVQRETGRVRVTAQLIDARTDAHVWAETYDRDLADVFAIQSEIAQTIVGQLQAKLSPQEKANMEERPTRDLAAFDLYLQAKEIVDSYLDAQDTRASLLKALRWLDEAVARDPNFTLAFCYAARAHDLLYFLGLDQTPARVVLGENAARTALRLQPNSAEAHLSMGDFYFRCHRDYRRAQEELELARPGLPNSTPFFVLTSYINRRLGHWDVAERGFTKAVKLDPRNPNAVNLLVDTYMLLRKFPEAYAAYDRAIAAGIDTPVSRIRGVAIDISATGDTARLREALKKAPPDLDVGGGETGQRIFLALIDHNYDEAERVLAASPRGDFQEVDFSFYYPRSWYEAIIARAKGDRAKQAGAFKEARTIFEERLALKPDDPRTLAVLAQVDAGLGQNDLAIQEAKNAAALMPVSRDAYDGPLILQGLAQVYTWSGKKDQALEVIQTLLSMPGYLTYGFLRIDPAWDPLRDDPRFQSFLASIAPKS